MESPRVIYPESSYQFTVDPSHAHERIDTFITGKFGGYSRTFLQNLISNEQISLNGRAISKPGLRLKEGDLIQVTFPDRTPEKKREFSGFDFGISIIHKDEHFLIINKPAGLIVHEADTDGDQPSVVDWIIENFDEIKHVGAIDRPGIVHRLDKDTSGILIIPRTNYAHGQFGAMFKERTIHKTYRALVEGAPHQQGSLDMPIGRHPVLRHKMATFTKSDAHRSTSIRDAITEYSVLEYFDECALVEAKPHTGRTHQIRVHLAALGHPLLGDQTYGKKSAHIKRHALHAYQISFVFNGRSYEFTCPVPQDFQQALERLKKS